MGYTTEFDGLVSINPPLNYAEVSFLTDFMNTRRMNRTRGPLYVGGTGFAGQHHDDDILDYNRPHPDQPGLWMKWEVFSDGRFIGWNGAEKFYDAPEWMKYIIDNLLSPDAVVYLSSHLDEDSRLRSFSANHFVNGIIEAQGEESTDVWRLIVVDNVVTVSYAELTYGQPEPV